jgi:hypothetical protein
VSARRCSWDKQEDPLRAGVRSKKKYTYIYTHTLTYYKYYKLNPPNWKSILPEGQTWKQKLNSRNLSRNLTWGTWKRSNSKKTKNKKISNAQGRQLGLNLNPAFWREKHQTELTGTVLFTTPAWGRTDIVRPCRSNGVPVLCEFPPHPSVDGPSIAKVQPALVGRYSLSTRCSCRPGKSCWVITYSVRVAPVAPDDPWFEICPCDGCWLLPLERRSRWPKSKEYHNTVPQMLRESLHSHTNPQRHKLSIDPWRRASRIVSSWRSVLRTTNSRDQ